MLVTAGLNGQTALMLMSVYVQKRQRINGTSMYREAVSCYIHSWAEDSSESLCV